MERSVVNDVKMENPPVISADDFCSPTTVHQPLHISASHNNFRIYIAYVHCLMYHCVYFLVTTCGTARIPELSDATETTRLCDWNP